MEAIKRRPDTTGKYEDIVQNLLAEIMLARLSHPENSIQVQHLLRALKRVKSWKGTQKEIQKQTTMVKNS